MKQNAKQFFEGVDITGNINLEQWNEIKGDITLEDLLTTIAEGPNKGYSILGLLSEMAAWSSQNENQESLQPFMDMWGKFQNHLKAKDFLEICKREEAISPLFSLAVGAYFNVPEPLWVFWDKFAKNLTMNQIYTLSDQERGDFDGKTLLWLLALEAHWSDSEAFASSMVDKFTSDLRIDDLLDEADNIFDGITTLWLLTCSAAKFPDKFQVLWDKILKDIPAAEFNALMFSHFKVFASDLNLLKRLEGCELATQLVMEKMNSYLARPSLKCR